MNVPVFSTPDHDHERCVRQHLAAAERLCRQRGVRLTARRRHVLELVLATHAPVGAYDLLESLRASEPRAAPPTVYRALDFLMEQGLVHRIDSLNAFVGCTEPGHREAACLLICRRCRTVGEIVGPAPSAEARELAAAAGFAVESVSMELAGLCARCRGSDQGADQGSSSVSQ